ncbi:LacI family transcriptional regulator [Noviherbaspirillum saxi]|uniref:LacI family transcriptional regulator n=2 Tax=Noviherbaspirillum saxi TaxID=2320863 RepID=A0A3A3FM11_9BURK|nr:LacI family DNA-binding transcriptional regulator [Noviherbaspirillum saxi]RJF95761.1 LacI family transcriptional regulator [Noviherbaspirillum saxi]
MKRNAPTLHDVAKAAGVSTATVSKFLNGAQRFSPAVEATINSVVAQIGYRSNELARSMITGETKTIGVAILDINNPHFTAVVKGANRVAIDAGYTLLFVDTEENQKRELQLLDTLSRRVDGLIISSRMSETDIKTVIDFGKPLVFFGQLETAKLVSICSAGQQGGYMLAQHLVNQGCKNIVYLGFSKSRWDRDRIAGVGECLESHGLSLKAYDAQAPFASEGERLCSLIMLGKDHPDAVICYNDLLAIGFMKEAQSLGFKIPHDVAVAGFDNVPYAEYVSPSLTSVNLQSEGMGELAMKKMLDLLAGRPTEEYTVLDPQLVLRESTSGRKRHA